MKRKNKVYRCKNIDIKQSGTALLSALGKDTKCKLDRCFRQNRIIFSYVVLAKIGYIIQIKSQYIRKKNFSKKPEYEFFTVKTLIFS